MTVGDAAAEAQAFTQRHLEPLSRELLHWMSKGKLPDEARFHTLATLVAAYGGEDDAYQLAERLVVKAALQATAAAVKPGAGA